VSYADYEASPQAGRPVELYLFTIGATVYRYTSAEDEYTFGAQVYYPRQIDRSSPVLTSEDKQQALEVTLPATDDVAARFVGVAPGIPMTLSVVRVHRDDPDQEAQLIWEGRITGAVFQKDATVISLQCLTKESAFSRTIPKFKFSGLCNHMLYDSSCGVLKASFQFDGTVSAVGLRSVTVPGLAAAKGAGWAVGGYLATADDSRMVIAQVGDVLTLFLDFAVNVLGSSVSVYAGCDHLVATCLGKFSNVVRFGGFPYVPERNPFTSGID
jgi:uncharacterized phage protein (TIGR02218 family)